jgi:hypothetical protein
MFVVSCNGLLKKKGDEDAAADAAPVAEVVDATAAPPAAPALATNEGDVARFPDETKLADVVAATKRDFNVREAPPAGVVIAPLAKGTNVTQIAKRGQFFLILWDNPAAPGTKLMGWVQEGAFTATPPKDAGALTCGTGEIPLAGDTPFCGKVCQADAECPSGQACKGQANKLLANGKAGDGVTVCTVFRPHDAGAPSVTDAGLKLILPPLNKDAGAAKPDAAAPPAPADPGTDTVAPTNGACPANFVLVDKTKKCHRLCTTATDKTECKSRPKWFCIKCDKETKKVCGESQDQCK